jgi:hypothetical protein
LKKGKEAMRPLFMTLSALALTGALVGCNSVAPGGGGCNCGGGGPVAMSGASMPAGGAMASGSALLGDGIVVSGAPTSTHIPTLPQRMPQGASVSMREPPTE